MKKAFTILLFVSLLTVVILPFPAVEGRVKSYYSGSSVAYKDQIVITTTNTGSLEIFVAEEGGDIQKIAKIKSTGSRFKPVDSFNDSLLIIEQGKLYVYAVDSYGMYKYDVSDLAHARLVKKTENTTWDWQGSLMQLNENIASVGSKGIAVLNDNLDVIDRYPIVKSETWDNAYNASASNSQKYIFSITNEEITIFDRDSRIFLKSVPLNVKWENRWYPHGIYNNQDNGSIYVVDDEAVRKINFNGEIEKSFHHTGKFGFDVVPSSSEKLIYFSDGIGVVALDAQSLAVKDYAYTTSLGGYDGWAMGLNVVSVKGKDRLVLFNSNGIVLLDEKLNVLKGEKSSELTIAATEEETAPDIIEPVSLGIDRNHAASNSTVNLHGKGYGSNEPLVITFGDQTVANLNADFFGQFSTEVVVPDLKRGPIDIKVKGSESKISYSLGFKID